MRGRTGFFLGLLIGLTASADAQVTLVPPPGSNSSKLDNAPAATTGLPASPTAADPVRIEGLRQSLLLRDPVPGVSRGWEGDPRTPTWVSRCDDAGDRHACWLVGIQLAPALAGSDSNAGTAFRAYFSDQHPSPRLVAIQYLTRGCDLGSGEACADLGDFYRFQNSNWTAPFERFDPKRAYGYYRRACELSSAYGCYVLAEMTDRGIGAPRDTALSLALFSELCKSDVAIGCLRLASAAAPHPYKVFSPTDSACTNSLDCLNACKQGTWGACRSVDWSRPMSEAEQKEVTTLAQKACREGSDWGCKTAYQREASRIGCEGKGCTKSSSARPLQTSLVEGCNAGSEFACRLACQKFSQQIGEPLACESRFPLNRYFAERTIQIEMQDCFGGDYQACDHFLTNTSTRMKIVRMTSDEASAYRASAQLFQRMACNALHYRCAALAQHYGDSQLGRAYRTAQLVTSGPKTDPAHFQSFTPMELAMASGWLMNMTARELALPEDVILELDGLCTRNYPLPLARACRALAEYFNGKSVTVSSNTERDAAFLGALKELNKLNASGDVGHTSCIHIPAGTVGPVTVVVTREMEACFDRVEREREERRAELRREANFWHGQPYSITTYNQELLATARDYYARACRAGDASACGI